MTIESKLTQNNPLENHYETLRRLRCSSSNNIKDWSATELLRPLWLPFPEKKDIVKAIYSRSELLRRLSLDLNVFGTEDIFTLYAMTDPRFLTENPNAGVDYRSADAGFEFISEMLKKNGFLNLDERQIISNAFRYAETKDKKLKFARMHAYETLIRASAITNNPELYENIITPLCEIIVKDRPDGFVKDIIRESYAKDSPGHEKPYSKDLLNLIIVDGKA